MSSFSSFWLRTGQLPGVFYPLAHRSLDLMGPNVFRKFDPPGFFYGKKRMFFSVANQTSEANASNFLFQINDSLIGQIISNHNNTPTFYCPKKPKKKRQPASQSSGTWPSGHSGPVQLKTTWHENFFPKPPKESVNPSCIIIPYYILAPK